MEDGSAEELKAGGEVKENAVRSIWNDGNAVINGWLAIPSSYATEVMAHTGFDSLTVDMQHGVVDYADAVTMFQAISTTAVTPLARVPWNDPAWIMKTLDAGAMGIICPMVNTAEDARRLVAACRYPPDGIRSFGPIRAKVAYGDDYHDHANEQVIVMPQVETPEAIGNLDDILSVPGVDAVYVGPSDLAMALGLQPRDGQTNDIAVAARAEILRICQRHEVPAGIHQQSAKGALEQLGLGFRFVTIASDNRFLAAKARAEVGDVRAALGYGGVDSS
jgi:4-hydroxy-2-oxoheptanedioate aldolase